MAEVVCTPRRIFLLTHTLRVFEGKSLVDPSGKPDLAAVAREVRRALSAHWVRGPIYLALSPDLVMLHTAPFPSFEGFPLEEAVLAEAQRNPHWRDEDLVVDYDVLRPEGPARVWVLFAGLPRSAARNLQRRLRARRIEPWPLMLWRAARSRYPEGESFFVAESLSNTLAVFDRGEFVGFRRLTQPLEEGGPDLAEEVARSLQLYGVEPPADRGLVFGLPQSPEVEGLPAAALDYGLELEELKRAAWSRTSPLLDLKPRRTRLGEGMPPDQQRALFLSALVLAAAVVSHSVLQTWKRPLAEEITRLEDELVNLRAELEEKAGEARTPSGPGYELVKRIAEGLPDGLWLTELTADRNQVRLTGRALNPYAPLDLAVRLGARITMLSREEEGVYAWEVVRALAPEAR